MNDQVTPAANDPDRSAPADPGRYLWLNGAVVPATEATISPLDRGLMVGDGVFETLVVADGIPFALTRHLRRLAASAQALGLPVPEEQMLRRAVTDLIAANGPTVGRLRITVTGGAGVMGSSRAGTGRPTVLVSSGPTTVWGPVAEVVVCPWARNERSAVAGIKTTSYAENAKALAFAEAHGANEALFANTAGNLCEGTGSNVFVVLDGVAHTPPLSAGPLAGVTRELVVEAGWAVETDLPAAVLHRADEVFLTSTTRAVQPVVRIDDRRIPVGPVTTDVAERFAALVARTTDP